MKEKSTFYKVESGASGSCRFDRYDNALRHAQDMARLAPDQSHFIFKLVGQVTVVPNYLKVTEYD